MKKNFKTIIKIKYINRYANVKYILRLCAYKQKKIKYFKILNLIEGLNRQATSATFKPICKKKKKYCNSKQVKRSAGRTSASNGTFYLNLLPIIS